MKTFRIRSTSDLPEVAEAILDARAGRTVIAFRGGMGAGKTTLIRAVCDRLGVTDTVTSPTFAIVNEYRGDGTPSVYHFDFYRIDRIVRRSTSATRSIFSAETFAWSSGPRRSRACSRTMR